MKLGPKRWLMERGLLGVAPAGSSRCGELAPELRVVQHAAVPVVGDLDLVRFCDVRGRSVIAADPGRQPRPGVGAGKVAQFKLPRAESIQ